MFRREAEGHGHVEVGQRLHLPVEPAERVGAEAVGPGQARAQVRHAEPLHPGDGVVEAVVVVVEPLAEAEVGRVPAELFQRLLRAAVLVEQAHGEMPVVGGALGLAVARRRLPLLGQVVEAVPVDARRLAFEQLGGAGEAPSLHLLRAKGGDADLRHPHGQGGHGLDLGDLRRPILERPQVPVERKAVHGDGVDRVEHAVPGHAGDEAGIDGRHAAEHAGDAGIDGADRLARRLRHGGEQRPVGVDGRVPMRLVVGLVPDHRRFDHALFSSVPRAG